MTKKISKKELKKTQGADGDFRYLSQPSAGWKTCCICGCDKQAKKTGRKERSQGLRLVSGFFIYTAIRHTLCKS